MTPDMTIPQQFERRVYDALGERVNRVVLFGSRARGDARDDSDWDFAIFLDHEPTMEEQRIVSDAGFDVMMDNHGVDRSALATKARETFDDASRLLTGCEELIKEA